MNICSHWCGWCGHCSDDERREHHGEVPVPCVECRDKVWVDARTYSSFVTYRCEVCTQYVAYQAAQADPRRV